MFKDLLKKVTDAATGGIGGALIEAASTFITNPADAQKWKVESERLQHEQTVALLELTNAAEAEFNQRIVAMEGTASDLKSIPIIGPLVIFLRGLQRPLWGFMVLFWDYKVYSGSWEMPPEGEMRTAFLIINFLILSFLFGERAFKNVAPLIERLIGARSARIAE